MNFKDKVYIVSGTHSGIGRGCAEALLNQEGWVIGLDIKEASIIHERYQHHLLDVTDEEQIVQLFNNQGFSQVDGLVNCAGLYAHAKPFFELESTEWHKIIVINLTATFLLSKYTALKMIPYKKGKIVNISCIRSKIFRPNMAEYAASKGGVVALTSAMALDLAQHHIQVNSVAPGFTDTEMTAQSFDDPKIRAFSESIIPVGRIGKPQDIAGVVLFLLSELSDYVNGETIFVDGGFKVLK